DLDPAGIQGLGNIDIGAQILIGSLRQVGRVLRNIDGGERMQTYGNASGFRTGTNGRTAFRGEGDKRLRARIQSEIDVVEPMGGSPAQSVFDGFLAANINPYTVDDLHVSSSPAGLCLGTSNCPQASPSHRALPPGQRACTFVRVDPSCSVIA